MHYSWQIRNRELPSTLPKLLLPRSGAIREQFAAEYVRFNQVGAQTQVQVDLDGSGGRFSFSTLATLNQTTAAALTAQNVLI
jgi:hypothetical protein